MQAVLKKYFWVLGALAIALCAFFLAKAVSHTVERYALLDSAQTPRVAVLTKRDEPAVVARSKDAKPVADRNMFCSECTPAVTEPTDPSSVPTTSLPLNLIATLVNDDAQASLATIAHADSGHQGAYRVGQAVPGAGAIREIRYKYVDFENNGRVERLLLLGTSPFTSTPEPIAAAPAYTPQASSSPQDEFAATVDASVHKINDTTYDIDRSLIDKILANPMVAAKGARIVPAVVDGKPVGIKIYSIKPNSPFAKIGLVNGDTISSINGMEFDSAAKGLEIYTKLKEATKIEMNISRRGKPLEYRYNIK